MISKEKAFEIVMSNCSKTGTEFIDLVNSLDRVLAEDVISDIDMPPYNRSAVDGYGCRKEELREELEVVEVIKAGMVPGKKVGSKQCVKIMTGAMMPDGCDFVFMVEYSKVLSSGKVIFTGTPLKPNFSLKGEDVRKGDIVLRKGKLIKPQDIAVLASVGCINVSVAIKPSVAVISTGDELVEPDQVPGSGGIRNSNAYQLIAQIVRAGALPKYYGIAPDDERLTYELIVKAITENDMIILTGGVSMGDYDFVPAVLKSAGVNILFDQVNVQPGKPTTFGIHEKAIIFGLPGNPVSAFIQFETLVRPLLSNMMGYEWIPVSLELPMAVRYERKAAVRAAWLPVIISGENEVVPSEYHGSAHITAFPYTHGIVAIAPGKNIIEKGEIVSVRQI